MLNFPVKEKKIKVKTRFFNYIVTTDKTNIIIKKRVDSDIWKGLYDFPLIETTEKLDDMNYPYESYVEEKEGHGFAKFENRVKLYKKIEEPAD